MRASRCSSTSTTLPSTHLLCTIAPHPGSFENQFMFAKTLPPGNRAEHSGNPIPTSVTLDVNQMPHLHVVAQTFYTNLPVISRFRASIR
jgi:hypothetical protein